MKTSFKQLAKTKLSILILAGFMLCSIQSCAQNAKTEITESTSKPDYSNVDYSIGSNIIENPEKLTGDEKAIFYHPYFLKLTSEEARNLDPLKVKEEFSKLEITTDQRARFVAAYSFFKTYCAGHKKSCEQWESFKDLAPKSQN